MLRAISCTLLFAITFMISLPIEAALREWDAEGLTSNWSEDANWTEDSVPISSDDASVGALPDAFDAVVLFDLPGDTVKNLTLVNGADFDTNNGRLVMGSITQVGTGSALGTTLSELIVRPRNSSTAAHAIDTNSLAVGANGLLTMAGGKVDIDGTGVQPGVLSVATGGALIGYGLIDMTDSDASLGVVSSLLVNEGVLTVGDPAPAAGEPTAVTLHLSAPNAPLFGQVDLGGNSLLGTVSLLRNATLKIDTAFSGAESMDMAANTTLEMSRDGTLVAGSTLRINSGVVSPGSGTELPAAPAIITGAGVLTNFGTIRLNQADEELIIESRINGLDGVLSYHGVVRFRGGGEIQGMAVHAFDDGVGINESTSVLNFQADNIYNTPLINEGQMGLLEKEGNATVLFGDFTQTAAGTLIVDLGGILAGEFEVLSVEGDAALAGTLDIDLAGVFEPALGNSFEIFTAPNGAITGQFDTIDFPVLAGLEFDIVYNAQSVVLEVIASSGGLEGDFDFDGDVDGADFLVWQRGESPDPLSETDLNDWQTNYGSPGSLSEISTAVPEPATVLTLAIGMLGMMLSRCGRHSS